MQTPWRDGRSRRLNVARTRPVHFNTKSIDSMMEESINNEIVLPKTEENKRYYYDYILEYIDYLYNHSNEEIENLLVDKIMNENLSIDYLIAHVRSYKYIHNILIKFSYINTNLIPKIISYIYNKNDIEMYLVDVIDRIDKKELEDFMIDNYKLYKVYTTTQVVTTFFVLDLNLKRLIPILKRRDPELLNEVISNQV